MVRFPLVVALILGMIVSGAGCRGPSQPPQTVWKGEKLGDLVPPPADRPPPAQFLATAYLDVHVVDLPADHVEKLEPLWQILSAAPIRLSSYNAFSENSFRLLFGKIVLWEKIRRLLADADGQHVTTVSLAVADNDKTDLPIAEIPGNRPIAFIANDLSRQTARVGAGVLALRLVAEPIPWTPGVRKIIGYPAYTVPVQTPIPELQAKAQQREFYFASAAFACQMAPGDLLVLGPEKYTGERVTLGGLFFNRPDEVLFFNADKTTPPQRRPAVRVYIIVCGRVSGP
ncbi:MAG: hypothetical protein MUC88_07755 [Planctomycetes bacterium]|jgi:hypothetical protein|nr:hypothetical protein [Planctomycetota bacterium]